MGWFVQTVEAELTRCWTHPGEVAADGLTTWGIMPSGMDDCACKMPSKIQIRPKAIRSRRRAVASGPLGSAAGAASSEVPGDDVPSAAARRAARSCVERSRFQATARIAMSTTSTSAWCSSDERNADTIVVLLRPRPCPIPPIRIVLPRLAATGTVSHW